MFKGFTVVVVALISTAQVDQYLTHGRYTDAAMAMLRQIGRAVGFLIVLCEGGALWKASHGPISTGMNNAPLRYWEPVFPLNCAAPLLS
ncbi:hypothetical protein [Bradyrhizobium sp. WSM1417]|uniref:hypothetical protein n=1 Tax=unclassified Bradyrhizobium TaxID=2631580 RepID=UPI0012ECAEF0|nr:hypothetical protein [Bradyrhizobium sp. WSM1417]